MIFLLKQLQNLKLNSVGETVCGSLLPLKNAKSNKDLMTSISDFYQSSKQGVKALEILRSVYDAHQGDKYI
jgi:hypothetical protein